VVKLAQGEHRMNVTVAAYLGLGSNMGVREGNLRATLSALDRDRAICVDRDAGIASLYETSPVGGPAGQSPYLNTVVRVRTDLAPGDLLVRLLSVEQARGRLRSERWGPRVIDIDLLLYGDAVCSSPELSLPHPHLHRRRFVLEPLAEIAPDLVHPVVGKTIRELAAALQDDPEQTIRRVAGRDWVNEDVLVA
jgi:2-amino-4-hydroxy-6-hydroxymethyldihydropteridine diphosphokinase